MVRTDIEDLVNRIKSQSQPHDRYTSFDYCYNYFKNTNNPNNDIEKSCLTLGFYLASWGMLRGSSFLLQKSAKYFESTIHFIASLDKSVWEIDVDCYSRSNILIIQEVYQEIKSRIIMNDNADLTLITKILLGVFGFIPAFDNYFCEFFRTISDGKCGFRRVNEKSLLLIQKFYESNQATIDRLSSQTYTTDFITGQKTSIKYPKAKIIDMYGFIAGQKPTLK
ncbi:hypothetical protein [Robiginitalea marina]|uniref:Uncharacterized protein n=1 Tax=Robiginitalea marina TaxID=2954105 RepID=A0ABT1AVI2_9FLAO|nr:hypothetical protein [Robiginitalea marina]MCO5723223.1 hypothetical protein [Robiginitalea marina]